MDFLTPAPLRPGDRIAIVSPAGIIKPQLVYEAAHVLSAQGWEVTTGRHTFDRYGTFAGTPEARLADLTDALLDPSVRAILCSRGGYGAVQLLEDLDRLPLRDDPKWIIGYSDISALHALMNSHGIKSLHAPMCRHLAETGGTDPYSQRLFDLLREKQSLEESNPYIQKTASRLEKSFHRLEADGNTGIETLLSLPPSPLNRAGSASGRLAGGNFAVISALFSTPYNVIKPGTILFIEDIAEPIYKVERMLYTLRLNGVLETLGGLIVGQFTRYEPSRDHETMEQMIAEMIAPYGYPVAFNAPIGHVPDNVPLVCGARVTLTVEPGKTTCTL